MGKPKRGAERARSKSDESTDEDEDDDEELDATAAREFLMARLAAVRAWLSNAEMSLDEMLQCMVMPDSDEEGKRRAELLTDIEEALAGAGVALTLAKDAFADVDPEEGEPSEDEA